MYVKKRKCNDEEFEEWLFEHECDINFAGSSPAMESEGAPVLWGRSIDHHNLRYKWMVCDRDSKAFNCVEHVYGETKVGKIGLCGACAKENGKTPP